MTVLTHLLKQGWEIRNHKSYSSILFFKLFTLDYQKEFLVDFLAQTENADIIASQFTQKAIYELSLELYAAIQNIKTIKGGQK